MSHIKGHPVSEKRRHHDLDALRAFAMLLGILLHGLMSFIGFPVWPAQDIHQNSHVYGSIVTLIHGFRMPLFFLISGFFTAMMWRDRGIVALATHRAKRIFLPLILGTAVLGPMITNMDRLAEFKRLNTKVHNQQGVVFLGNPAASIWNAAKQGDTPLISKHLNDGADINGKDDKHATPLHWAAGLGHPQAVDFLLENGAEVDSRDGKNSTPLHWAALFGQPETVQRLIYHNATVDMENDDGATPLDATKLDRTITEWIARILGIRVDVRTIMATRSEVVTLLDRVPPDSKGIVKSIWEAAQKGNVEFISRNSVGGSDINALEPRGGSSPLLIAALHGQLEATRTLLEKGADVEMQNNDGATPLHVASFFGHREIVELLLAQGANPQVENNKGETPLDTVITPWSPKLEGIYRWIATMLELELDYERIKQARPEIARRLGASREELAWLGTLTYFCQENYTVFGTFVFHHLWFLYDLILLVIVFVVVACMVEVFGCKPLPPWMIASSFRWLWLVPLTFVPQYFMNGFGADTSVTIVPNWTKLAYYGIFFGFGAICFSCKDFERKVGRYWSVCLALAIPVFCCGLKFMEHRGEDWRRDENWSQYHAFVGICSATYAWLVIFGLIGFVRQFFSDENKTIRYISDSAYWLYLAHLPLIQVMQIWVSDWPFPSFSKLIFICVVSVGMLLLMYEYLVRYTWLGTMLNGKRTRNANGKLNIPAV